MKTIVVYYSRKGSNKYLANKIATNLSCDCEEIKPRINAYLLFLMNINFGIKALKHNIKSYDKVILCGPIMVGRFLAPLKSFVKKYFKSINKLVFVTCCGSSYDKKDEQFGHGLVFNEVKKILNEKCISCQAFPIDLVLTESEKKDDTASMNTHLNDVNFKGEIQERFNEFIESMNKINEVV
jgi:menaquinone-dependent protoporphyrinogen IX oxidase